MKSPQNVLNEIKISTISAEVWWFCYPLDKNYELTVYYKNILFISSFKFRNASSIPVVKSDLLS